MEFILFGHKKSVFKCERPLYEGQLFRKVKPWAKSDHNNHGYDPKLRNMERALDGTTTKFDILDYLICHLK